ncbi:MAG TPA: transcription antitermination factor NusB [Candidatus Tenderia electrophaga]|uniref:Transcription antitermination protein NusB n=1 Tax=Candidatus Tenderia electrophaga TaxID=1748243 RepID=A0A832J386_9GAMM|nr:transcription antitermination factor NusB [Candidatus Tenderia electrophaga]
MARRCAVQALYQWQLTGQNVDEIYQQFLAERNMAKIDTEMFKELLTGITKALDKLDEKIQPHLDRDIAEVDPVERAVLRLGAYELMYKPELPYRVAINESLEAVKTFGAEQGHRFVNGVLDKLAQDVREQEVQRKTR